MVGHDTGRCVCVNCGHSHSPAPSFHLIMVITRFQSHHQSRQPQPLACTVSSIVTADVVALSPSPAPPLPAPPGPSPGSPRALSPPFAGLSLTGVRGSTGVALATSSA